MKKMYTLNKRQFTAIGGSILLCQSAVGQIAFNGTSFSDRLDLSGINTNTVFGAGQTFTQANGWEVTVQTTSPANPGAITLGSASPFPTTGTNPVTNPEFIPTGAFTTNNVNAFFVDNAASGSTTTTTFTFNRAGSTLSNLQTAIFSVESIDAETDTISHSGGNLTYQSAFANDVSITSGASNSSSIGITGNTGGGVRGGYFLTTDISDGDVITFNYNFTGAGTGGQALGFAFAPVPEPSSSLLLGLSGLALIARRKRNK